MKTTYSEGFKEQAVNKVFSRGNRTVQSVADELNITYFTLRYWMKNISQTQSGGVVAKEKRPQAWAVEEQLLALQESYGLQGEALNAWCRERGLFTHHLTSWKDSFCAAGKAAPGISELRSLQHEIQQLKRELVRKEKALAEAAALLVLQKKFQALWEDEVI